MDIVSKEQRHYIMSRIRGKNTSLETIVRKYLFSRGLRYRLHDKKLPGNPDIIFKKYRTVIFINGCFWHQHFNCKYAHIPKTNREYWVKKLANNIKRDEENLKKYKEIGWNVIVVWECELKPSYRQTTLQRIYYEIIYSASPYNFNLNLEKSIKHLELVSEDIEDY